METQTMAVRGADRREVLRTLERVLPALGKARIMEATEQVLVIVEETPTGGMLRLYATDLEITLGESLEVPGEGLVPGGLGVPGTLLRNLLRKMEDGPLDLVSDGRMLTLKQGASQMRLVGMVPDDLPAMREVLNEVPEVTYDTDPAAFREALDATMYYQAPRKPSEPMTRVHAVQLNPGPEGLLLSACDGHRAVIGRLRPAGADAALGDTVRMVAGDHVRRILTGLRQTDGEAPAQLGGTEARWHVTVGTWQAAVQWLQATPFDFGMFLNPDLTLPEAQWDRVAMRAACDRAAVYDNRGGLGLTITCYGEHLTLHTRSTMAEDFFEDVPLCAAAEAEYPETTTIRTVFLQDALGLLEEGAVRARQQDKCGQLFLDDATGKALHVIMPLFQA